MSGVNGDQPAGQVWVLDASATQVDIDMCAYCPLTLDGTVIDGMTLVTNIPPGPVIGVYHPDGQKACEEWVAENEDYVKRVMKEARGE